MKYRKIAFFVHAAEMINHYQSVWRLLGPCGFDVLLHGSDDEIIESKIMIEELGYRCYTTRYILEQGYQYDVVVSNHSMFDYAGKPIIHLLGGRRVRFMYALGKARHNFSSWNEHFDLILCFGPWQDEKIKKCCHAVSFQMGYPRYDEYFHTIEDKYYRYDELGLDKSKKTILWLPTWLELSSLSLYADVMSSLSDEYNVIIKTHPLSVRAEPDILKKLEKYPCTKLITHVYDNLKLFRCSDFVVCDYGGTPFGALYLDKNLLLLNVPGAEQDELVGENSPDINLREHIINISADNRWDIPALLSDESIWASQINQRKKLRNIYFSSSYGFSSELAVLALKNIEILIAKG